MESRVGQSEFELVGIPKTVNLLPKSLFEPFERCAHFFPGAKTKVFASVWMATSESETVAVIDMLQIYVQKACRVREFRARPRVATYNKPLWASF